MTFLTKNMKQSLWRLAHLERLRKQRCQGLTVFGTICWPSWWLSYKLITNDRVTFWLCRSEMTNQTLTWARHEYCKAALWTRAPIKACTAPSAAMAWWRGEGRRKPLRLSRCSSSPFVMLIKDCFWRDTQNSQQIVWKVEFQRACREQL